ncbi:oligosaccharide flippase family protein [Paenibacillus methanolicus]|nr:oligosaccharide flippase family protein [Paenibacillus methanolicus]
MVNAAYLFASHVLVRLLTAFATILVARYLNVHDYGILSLALSYCLVTAFFTELGFTHTLIREGTKNKADLNVLMSSYFRARAFITLLTLLFTIVLVWFLYESTIREALYWATIPSIIGSLFVGLGVQYFQVTQQMKFSALIRSITGGVTALVLFVGVYYELSLIALAAIYGFSTVLGGIISCSFVWRKVKLNAGWDRAILHGVASFTITSFVIMIMPQIGPLVLERISTMTEVGYFSAAYRVPSILYQIPSVLALAFYPLLFKLGNSKDAAAHKRLNVMQIKFMSITGMMISLPFILYPDWWIGILLGDKWAGAATILSILSYIVILQSINSPLSDSLATTGLHKRRSYFSLAIFAIGIFTYVLLGRQYGALGGGYAALTVEALTLVGLIIIKPSGVKLFFAGVSRTFTGFAVAWLMGMLISRYTGLSPLLGMIVVEIVFFMLVLVLEKELREGITGVIAKKLKIGRSKPFVENQVP